MFYSVNLNSIPLLEGIDSQTRIFLENKVRLVPYPKNGFVVLDGDDSHDLFFLMEGSLEILTTSSKGELVPLGVITVGEHFGELSVIGGGPRTATVKASIDSLVGVLKREDAIKLIEISPLVAMRIMKKMAEMIRRNNELRIMYSIKSTPHRIYHYILNESQALEDETKVLEGLPKQTELASMLNISRESVSRVLNKLVKDQVIKKMPGKIIILAPRKLQAMSEEDD